MNHLKLLCLLAALGTTPAMSQVLAPKIQMDNLSYVQLESVKSLYSKISISEDKKKLTIIRSADNNEFNLNLVTAELEWRGQIIGIVPNVDKIKVEELIFPVNIVETLTGTNAQISAQTVSFDFDSKLKSGQTWSLYINGEVSSTNIKSIGNILLIPIESVAKTLGSRVDFTNSSIIYSRLQDGARTELNTTTGVVKVNEKIVGTVGDVFYIDRSQKLVPLNIAEILAGVTYTLEPKTNRVDFRLDPRISNTAFGSKLIAQELHDTPLTIQSFGYDVNSEGATTLRLDTYLSSYNTRLNYQSGASIFEPRGATPSLLNLEWSSYSGSSGTLGDVNLANRELSGIGISRIRGFEYTNITKSGDYRYSLAGGQIVQNTNQIVLQQFNDIVKNTKTYVPPQYGGAALGMRIYPKNKPYELGLSYLDDPQLGRQWLIGSYTYKSDSRVATQDWNYYLNVDMGYLKNELSPGVSDSALDLRGNWAANKNYDKLALSIDGSYSGQRFEQYYIASLENLINLNNNTSTNPISPLLPNVDNVGFSKFSQNAHLTYQLSNNVSLSYGLSYNLRKNDINSYNYLLHNIGLSRSFQSGSISLNNIRGSGTDVPGDYSVNIYNLLAQKNTSLANFLGRLDYDSSTKAYTGQVSTQFKPWSHDWSLALGTFNSSATYNFYKKSGTSAMSNESLDLNTNFLLSSNRLWPGWDLSAGAGVSYRVYEKNSNPTFISDVNGQSSLGHNKLNPFLFANASYALNRKFRVNISTSYDRSGEFKIFAGVQGDIDFAPVRTVSNYLPNRGVVRGRVFIDDNLDGVWQPSENKPVTARVSIQGTGLSLSTNNSGNFTIQNLSPGLYDLSVSLDNFPLGWVVDESAMTRFSISPDNITELQIPIKRVFSVVGQVVSASQKNTEQLSIQLSSADGSKKSLTTFGGQFSFDGLKLGKYTLEVVDENEKSYVQEVNLVDAQSPNKVIININ